MKEDIHSELFSRGEGTLRSPGARSGGEDDRRWSVPRSRSIQKKDDLLAVAAEVAEVKSVADDAEDDVEPVAGAM